MKNKTLLTLLLITIAGVKVNAESLLVQKIKMRVKFSFHCEGGFGFCPTVTMSSGRAITDPREADVDVYILADKLIMEIDPQTISPELRDEFIGNRYLPIDENVILPESVIENLALREGTYLHKGNYTINYSAELIQIVIPVTD